MRKRHLIAPTLIIMLLISACGNRQNEPASQSTSEPINLPFDVQEENKEVAPTEAPLVNMIATSEEEEETNGQKEAETEKTEETSQKETIEEPEKPVLDDEIVEWNPEWEYADYSAIHTGSVMLYRAKDNRKDKVVAVNAGHGTTGGASVQTQCHPDGSPKVTGGSTAAGSITAPSVSQGTTLSDGTSEAEAVLNIAVDLKEKLLNSGYDVLMIRETEDQQLDNIARTVIANNNADCHISIHYDSTSSDKGMFYISVPDAGGYKNMEPVASHWQEHNRLGEAIVAGAQNAGVNIYGSGNMSLDLTQTSYSTIPSVDVEVGDRMSDHSKEEIDKIINGILSGVNTFFAN